MRNAVLLVVLLCMSGCAAVETVGDAVFGSPPATKDDLTIVHKELNALDEQIAKTQNADLKEYLESVRAKVAPATQNEEEGGPIITPDLVTTLSGSGLAGVLFYVASRLYKNYKLNKKTADQTIAAIASAFDETPMPDSLKAALSSMQDEDVKKKVAITKVENS